MGFLDDVGNAKKSEGGNYFKPGFVGLVKIQNCKAGETRKKEEFFATSFEVVTSNLGPDGLPLHQPGEIVSHYIGIKPDSPAAGNVRDLIEKGLTALLGQKVDLGRLIKENPGEYKTTIQSVVGEDQALAGTVLKLCTVQTKTKAGRDFTVHTYSIPEQQAAAA